MAVVAMLSGGASAVTTNAGPVTLQGSSIAGSRAAAIEQNVVAGPGPAHDRGPAVRPGGAIGLLVVVRAHARSAPQRHGSLTTPRHSMSVPSLG